MQLELLREDPESAFLEMVRRLITLNGLKVVAEALGMDEQGLSHAVNRSVTGTGKRKRYIPAEKIGALIDLPGGEALIEWQASRRGLALVRETPATVEEKYEGILDAIDTQLGGELRKGLLRAASRSVRARRGYLKKEAG